MKINIQEVMELAELEVNICTPKIEQVALSLNQYIQQFNLKKTTIAVQVEAGVELVAIDNLVAVEVNQNDLYFILEDRTIVSKGTLKNSLSLLPDRSFIQVSKSAVACFDKMIRLENYFSGNLLAIFNNGYKLSISRRYVKELYKKLNI